MTASDDVQLLEQIASYLDDTQRKLIEAECERMRAEFCANFTEALTAERANFAEALTAKQMRELLRVRQKVLAKAAKTITIGRLQDADWLPHAVGYLGPKPDTDDTATVQWRALLRNLSSTEIAGMLWVLSKQAKFVADRLIPSDPRTSPTKNATAIYAYMLWTEFAPRRGRTGRQPKAPQVTDKYDESKYDELIVANWPQHTPEFRAAYGRLRQVRDRAPRHLTLRQKDEPRLSITIPVPKPAKLARVQPPVPPLKLGTAYVRPRHAVLAKQPAISNKFPRLASLLYQYFTGTPDVKMEWSCRKLFDQLKNA